MHNFKTNGNFSKYLSLTNLFRLKISYNRDLVVGLEKVVIRGGNCQGSRKLGAHLEHSARAILRRNKKQTWLNLANDDFI